MNFIFIIFHLWIAQGMGRSFKKNKNTLGPIESPTLNETLRVKPSLPTAKLPPVLSWIRFTGLTDSSAAVRFRTIFLSVFFCFHPFSLQPNKNPWEARNGVSGHLNIFPQSFSQALTSVRSESSRNNATTTTSEAHIMGSSQFFIEILFSPFFWFKFQFVKILEWNTWLSRWFGCFGHWN